MKEYGGFIELESFHGEILHGDAIPLNCGRNAVVYLHKAKGIKRLRLPRFLCSSVPEVCKRVGIEVRYYSINEAFIPYMDEKLEEDEYLYIVNYYGQLNLERLAAWKEEYGNIIVDNAQAYYQMPLEGVDTLYTCRKYFGVPDGAFLYTDAKRKIALPLDESYERMRFLLGRYERGANEFYQEYVENNRLFSQEPVRAMSKLTRNLLRGIDYRAAGERRRDNFAYLNERLGVRNRLKLTVPFGAYMYPLSVEDGPRVRERLLRQRIYVPILWPNVLDTCGRDTLEYDFAANILPLPIDQRYGRQDMEYIAEVVEGCID